MSEIGIIVLGQTPRPDLESLFGTYLPGSKITIQGGLDEMAAADIDALSRQGGDYLLLTILADGTTREIAMDLLLPHLNRCAQQLAANGASSAVLICAGDFPDLESPIPIIYPGRIVPAVTRAVSRSRRIGVVTPNPGQVEPARAHWQEKGFTVRIVVASPKDPTALETAAQELRDPSLELIVLDCMGFAPKICRRMRQLVDKPVICPQSLVARMAAELAGSYPL